MGFGVAAGLCKALGACKDLRSGSLSQDPSLQPWDHPWQHLLPSSAAGSAGDNLHARSRCQYRLLYSLGLRSAIQLGPKVTLWVRTSACMLACMYIHAYMSHAYVTYIHTTCLRLLECAGPSEKREFHTNGMSFDFDRRSSFRLSGLRCQGF